MKKIIAICMAALLLLAALPVSLVLADAVNAGNPIEISGTVDKAAACAGQEFTLTVKMANNPGLVGWNVTASFDEAAFELVELAKGTAFPASKVEVGPLKSPASVTFADFAVDADYTNTGDLYTAKFKVKENAVDGDYEIVLGTMRNDMDNFCNLALDFFEVNFGKVSVKVGHNYVANKTKNEDCGNDGEMTYACACGASYTEPVPATGAHTYANACDADCNVCGATRTPADHVYDNACDADCNVCGVARTPADHVYDNACDADCNVCGATRTPAAHKSDAAYACVAGKCTECGADVAAVDHTYTYACDKNCAVCGAETNPTADHKVGKVDAHDPDCHRVGNVEYWTCADCGNVWLDEAMTQPEKKENVIIPAKGDVEAKHVEAKAATVDAEGNIEYWYCESCEQFWTDEALTQLTNSKSVILPKLEPAPTEPTTKPDDSKPDDSKPAGDKTGENVTVILVSGLIALIAAAAVVLFSKKKA